MSTSEEAAVAANARNRDDLDDFLAAREAHNRLVHEIQQIDCEVAKAHARRRTLHGKLIEIQALMRGRAKPMRSEQDTIDQGKVIGVLPGGVSVIADRCGLEKARVKSVIKRLHEAGRVYREGYTWFLAPEGDSE